MTATINTFRIWRSKIRILVICTLFFCFNPTFSQGIDTKRLMAQRMQSAEQIIADISKLEAAQKKLHLATELQIAQAVNLQGEAHKLQMETSQKPFNLKLTKEQIQDAKQQYQADINQFAAHAQAYNQHLQRFKSTIGECQANNQALGSIIDRYQIHVQQFHLPMSSIRPPHICGRLEGRMGNLPHVANQMMYDQLRLMQSEGELQNQQEALRSTRGLSSSLKDKAVSASQRAQNEEELAAEFGRLHQEYTLLKSEKESLDGAIKLTQTSVTGQIKPSK